jgi:modulator of FtsH protease HflC
MSTMTIESVARRAAAPKIRRLLGVAGVAILALIAVGDSTFTVDPAERAAVRLFGTVMSDQPLQPGLHFKMPFVTQVDRAQVSLTNLHVPTFSVNTIDNQKIDLDINVSYTTPDSAVFHLLYQVGRSGSADVTENIIPVVQDRVGRVFSARNTNTISESREAIQAETFRQVQTTLRDLFKIELASLQIAKVGYSEAFITSNEKSVTAKNDAIAEQNKVKISEFQAKQRTTLAEGEAQQARVRAQGEADALRTRAAAERDAAALSGEGTALRLKAELEGSGGFSQYVQILQAQARLKWDGKAPGMLISGAGSVPTMLLPALDVLPKQ